MQLKMNTILKGVSWLNKEKLYIDGDYVDSAKGRTIAVVSPINQEILAQVADATKKDVELAVLAAKNSQRVWKNVPFLEKIQLASKFLDYLKEHRDEIVKTMVEELGSAITFTESTQFDFYIRELEDLLELLDGFEFIESFRGYDMVKDPVGVVACITPWNYPLGQITKKILPALLMGNSVILKPSTQTPLTAHWVAKAIDAAGYPRGVFNLLTGKGSRLGDCLTTHPDINMVTFTGSTEVGTKVAASAMTHMKRVTMELGGKSASIILEGADLDLALDKTLDTVCYNSGQTCSALTRLLVPEKMKHQVEQMLLEKVENYKVGHPFNRDVQMGPVQSFSQLEKIRNYIAIGLDEGAKLLYGESPKDMKVKPVIFTNVKNNMKIAQDEIFGPVLCVISYRDTDEAISLANDSEYGLSGAVFGEQEEAIAVARELKTGNIFVNTASKTTNVPFGGFKYSGVGRENGIEGVLEFVELKALINPLD